MDSVRFMHLRDLIGYDNQRIAGMLNIDLAEVEGYCSRRIAVPDKHADDLELFADWCCEVSHTETKRELAKIYLNRPDQA